MPTGPRHIEIKPFEMSEFLIGNEDVIPEIFTPRLRRAGTNPVPLKSIRSLFPPPIGVEGKLRGNDTIWCDFAVVLEMPTFFLSTMVLPIVKTKKRLVFGGLCGLPFL